jgi:CheY-like chemotaxis protein
MSATAEVKSLNVFLVENHADTLQSLKLYLEDSGHTVNTAMTVSQTLALLPRAGCDLFICDIGLPDGTGWEIMQKLPRTIFGVAMSGFGMNADSERSKAAGFRYHLLKPFKAVELDKILAEAVAEKEKAGDPE